MEAVRLCTHCWQERRVGEEIAVNGIATCHACAVEKRRALDRVRWWKAHPVDDHRACRRCGTLRRVPGEIRPQGVVCASCQQRNKLARERYYHRQRYAAMPPEQRADYNRRKTRTRDPERHRLAAERWREANPEKAREASRRWRQKMMANPKLAAEHRENDRIYQRIWRERRGIAAHPPTPQRYAEGNGASAPRGTVPAVLLAPLIREWLGEYGGRQLSNSDYTRSTAEAKAGTGAGQEELAALTGVSDRSLREILTGKRENVQLVTADRLCTVLNVPLTSLYFGDSA